MASHELIDTQFDRAVEIVQGLPKTGPIQTDYEEKLQMYSLYKQATVGNVKSPRPGIWDMLGRAKWDAWAKHRDLDPYEAKWLYVEALLKVLRRYSDKTTAQTLVQELESYGGDPSNLVLSRTTIRSPGSDTSGSTASRQSPTDQQRSPSDNEADSAETDTEEDNEDHQEGKQRPVSSGGMYDLHGHGLNQTFPLRPHSSQSANRYQTPNTGSLVSQTPLGSIYTVPERQPLPTFQTPSAFPAPGPRTTPGSAYHPHGPHTISQHDIAHPELSSSTPHIYSTVYRGQSQSLPTHLQGPVRPASRITIERAVENVQAHLAALTERLETLEARSLYHSSPASARDLPFGTSFTHDGSASGRLPGRGSPRPTWDLKDLGMWSYVLNPISRVIEIMHKLARFFARDESRSPTRAIIRRLCLDISFLICVVAIIGAVWKKSGVRRREVQAALVVLWRAIVGNKVPASVQGRGV